MGARHKLNGLHLHGSLVVAFVAGVIMQSWVAFLLILVMLVLIHLHSGKVRLSQRSTDLPKEE